jgi:antitoxin CptB
VTSALELRRKRLLYRSLYRGNKETDLVLGAFARAHIAGFDALELDEYEQILAQGDNDLFDWVAGRAEPPAALNGPVMRRLIDFKKVK